MTCVAYVGAAPGLDAVGGFYRDAFAEEDREVAGAEFSEGRWSCVTRDEREARIQPGTHPGWRSGLLDTNIELCEPPPGEDKAEGEEDTAGENTFPKPEDEEDATGSETASGSSAGTTTPEPAPAARLALQPPLRRGLRYPRPVLAPAASPSLAPPPAPALKLMRTIVQAATPERWVQG